MFYSGAEKRVGRAKNSFLRLQFHNRIVIFIGLYTSGKENFALAYFVLNILSSQKVKNFATISFLSPRDDDEMDEIMQDHCVCLEN
jgi:hypothetical protein